MKQYLRFLLIPLLFLNCHGKDPVTNDADVHGTWTGTVTVTSCTPEDVCGAVGFPEGQNLEATLIMTQDRNVLEGTYSYTGTPVNIQIEGRVAGTQVSLNGATATSIGSVTLGLNGPVSGDTLAAAITHQITLADSRAAIISASGTLMR